MTISKQSKSETAANKPATQAGELPDAALNQASGGALNAYMPTDVQHGTGGGGGAGKTELGDGSVRTNSTLIGLL